MVCVTSPVHELFEFGDTKDQPLGKSTIKVSVVPTVIKVAVTTIGVAFVPVTPISEVEVAVALVIVAAFAGAQNSPNVKPMLAVTVARFLEAFFTISPWLIMVTKQTESMHGYQRPDLSSLSDKS